MRSTLAAVLFVCFVSPVHADWNTYHGGADLRGVSGMSLPDQTELIWRYNAGGAVYATPVSDGERIFFTAKKGQVIALDLTGSERWKKGFTRTNDAGAEMPVQFDAPLFCADGLVFAGTSRGTLIALDAETGEEKWRYETGGIITGSPNVIAGEKTFDREDAKTQREEMSAVVVLDQSEGALHTVDSKTGLRLWKTDGVGRADGSPGIGGGRVVFGSCLSALHVYSTADGTRLRDIEIGGDAQVAGGTAIAGDLAFAGARDGQLVCANAATGEMVWNSRESMDQTFSTPAVTQNQVIYSSDNGFVYAVDREQGKTLWIFETGGLPTSPVVAQNQVAVSADGVLYLLSLKDGQKLWSKQISDEISSPALIGGMIVVGADDGTVSAFGSSPSKMQAVPQL
ncbi:MAG: PQQ-binding-like beta-propeller repeat protein [Pontiellaceae bacterium]|nr:PQQ-binding-like beta-propeller repeat protein [Pontiellaceae bacterium]